MIKKVRQKTADSMTFDKAYNLFLSNEKIHPGKTFDHAITKNGKAYDSTGAFLVGELERLDQKLHKPLASVTWGRDIKLRGDVTIADDVSSFTVSTFSSVGGLGNGNVLGTGKSWIGRRANQMPTNSVDIAKITNPLTPWGEELQYTIFELESAAKLGRPIDQQKLEALQLKHQMDIDEMVYIGSPELQYNGSALGGLFNNSLVSSLGTVSSVPTGSSGYTTWSKKTPEEILADISNALSAVWAASAWAVIPNEIRIPPAQFAYISNAKVATQAGNISILRYVKENNLLTTSEGTELNIQPSKWLAGSTNTLLGTALNNGGSDRMVVYTNEEDRVRFPMTLLQRTPLQFDSIYHKSTYFCKLGVVEAVYPETIGYFDGI